MGKENGPVDREIDYTHKTVKRVGIRFLTIKAGSYKRKKIRINSMVLDWN